MNDTQSYYLGQAWTLSDTYSLSFAQEVDRLVHEFYIQSIKRLKEEGKIAIGQPKFFVRPSPIDPLATEAGWKQQFEYVGEFTTWMEDFKKQQLTAVQTV